MSWMTILLVFGLIAGLTVEIFKFFRPAELEQIANKKFNSETIQTASHEEKLYPLMNFIYFITLIASFFTGVRVYGMIILGLGFWFEIVRMRLKKKKKNIIYLYQIEAIISLILICIALYKIIII